MPAFHEHLATFKEQRENQPRLRAEELRRHADIADAKQKIISDELLAAAYERQRNETAERNRHNEEIRSTKIKNDAKLVARSTKMFGGCLGDGTKGNGR